MGLNYYDNIEYFINDSAKDWKKGLLSKAQSISIEHCKGNHVLDVGGGRGELALSLANKKNSSNDRAVCKSYGNVKADKK